MLHRFLIRVNTPKIKTVKILISFLRLQGNLVKPLYRGTNQRPVKIRPQKAQVNGPKI